MTGYLRNCPSFVSYVRCIQKCSRWLDIQSRMEIDTVDGQIQQTDRHSIQIDTADRQTQMDRYSRRIDIVDRQIKQMDRYRQKQSRQIDTVDGQIQTEIEQTEIGRPDACFFVAAIFSFSCQKFKLRKNLMTAHGRSKTKMICEQCDQMVRLLSQHQTICNRKKWPKYITISPKLANFFVKH